MHGKVYMYLLEQFSETVISDQKQKKQNKTNNASKKTDRKKKIF